MKQLPAQGSVETGIVGGGGGRKSARSVKGMMDGLLPGQALGLLTRRPHSHVPPGRARINIRFHLVTALGPQWPDLSPQLTLQSSAAVITD